MCDVQVIPASSLMDLLSCGGPGAAAAAPSSEGASKNRKRTAEIALEAFYDQHLTTPERKKNCRGTSFSPNISRRLSRAVSTYNQASESDDNHSLLLPAIREFVGSLAVDCVLLERIFRLGEEYFPCVNGKRALLALRHFLPFFKLHGGSSSYESVGWTEGCFNKRGVFEGVTIGVERFKRCSDVDTNASLQILATWTLAHEVSHALGFIDVKCFGNERSPPSKASFTRRDGRQSAATHPEAGYHIQENIAGAILRTSNPLKISCWVKVDNGPLHSYRLTGSSYALLQRLRRAETLDDLKLFKRDEEHLWKFECVHDDCGGRRRGLGHHKCNFAGDRGIE